MCRYEHDNTLKKGKAGLNVCEYGQLSPVLSDRSTPCPSVKHGDEWGEPSKCESGDSCQYCHSRTEQQFHPEVSELKLLSNYFHN